MTRFGPGELEAGAIAGQRQPPLPSALWLRVVSLMTAEKRAWWERWLAGKPVPAVEFAPAWDDADADGW